ncbi:sensor histidine kinase [Streptosporangiaceae bacterium NEAU-GS5]|nr:sensor histidine kinase [Streptosporangiaceae bacterium NEAU-GS5]
MGSRRGPGSGALDVRGMVPDWAGGVMITVSWIGRADRPGPAWRGWRMSARAVALTGWIVAVVAAAVAVGMVLALRRSGGPVPQVYLDNVWPALVLPGAGLLLVGRPPYRAIGRLFVLAGVGAGLAAFGFAFAAWAVHRPGLYGWAGAGVWAGKWMWMAGLLPPLAMLWLPEGRVRGWRRGAVVAAVVAIGVQAVFSALSGSTSTDPITGATLALPNPLAVRWLEPLAWPLLVVTFAIPMAARLAGAVYLTWRWRRAAGRARSRLAVLGVAAWAVVLPWAEIPVAGQWLDMGVVPVFAATVTAALLRYGGGDVDGVLGRSYLWASLTTCVVATYLLVVTVLGALVQRAAGASLAVAASGVVALLVAPLRTRLQRSVDRLLYGARADPYASVAALSRRLEGGMSPDEVLPAVARTITDELRLPYAAFHLTGHDGSDGPNGEVAVAVAEHGTPGGDLIVLPVEYLGAQVGNLVVSTGGHGVVLRAAERRLLADLARQSGAAAHGVATLTQLRRSRERLVAAREEERRSLRRELHDDLGAMLTGVALGVDAAGNHVPVGSPAAEQLGRVRAVVSAAVDDLRRIIDGLRPPALDEVGLVGAIRDRLLTLSDDAGPDTEVRADPLPALPPEVEVACYHVAVEAVHNAVRHAGAGRVTVTLAMSGDRLDLAVTDDGCGITAAAGDPGHGLVTMRQRAEEIGGRFSVTTGPGGTAISATFPTGGRR